MALAKIVGFEVAPVTPRSTRRAKSPLSRRSRERVSSQIDTPAFCESWRRFMVRSPSSMSGGRGRELLERYAGIREPARVDGLPGPNQLLDRFRYVPYVHVHSGEYPAPGHPERDELALGRVPSVQDLVPFGGVAGVLHPNVVLV